MPVGLGRRLCLAICVLGLIAGLPQGLFAADLRLGYPDQAVYPFHAGEGREVAQPPGMAVDLTLRLLRQSGLSVDLVRLPIRRLHEEMRAGRVDGWIGLSYTPERAEYLAFPMRDAKPDHERRLLVSHYALYRPLGGSAHWQSGSIAGLNGGSLGMPAGFALAQEMRAAGQGVEEFGDAAHMFRLLDLGRLGAVLAKENAADRLIASQRMRRIEKLSGDLSRDYFLAIGQQAYAARRAAIERLWNDMAAQREAVYAELAPLYH